MQRAGVMEPCWESAEQLAGWEDFIDAYEQESIFEGGHLRLRWGGDDRFPTPLIFVGTRHRKMSASLGDGCFPYFSLKFRVSFFQRFYRFFIEFLRGVLIIFMMEFCRNI